MDKYIFGITGATGAGKSTVSSILRKYGVFVADADKAAREVTTSNSDCIKELKNNFGADIYTADNRLNRQELAQIVFNDENKLKLLNSITHKYIKQYIENELMQSEAAIAAVDGAVLIGSPVMDLCQKLVVVTADEKIRKERIIKRDFLSNEMAENRISSQMTNAEYEKYADFIIVNNGDNVRLEECVEQVYIKIKNLSKTACPSSG